MAGEGDATGQQSASVGLEHALISHILTSHNDILIYGGHLIQAGLPPASMRHKYSRNKEIFE